MTHAKKKILNFQESIMTPRSRKPLIITSEQRDTLTQTKENIQDKSESYHSMSPKNDSDFVSSDDEETRSTYSCDRLVVMSLYSEVEKCTRPTLLPGSIVFIIGCHSSVQPATADIAAMRHKSLCLIAVMSQ